MRWLIDGYNVMHAQGLLSGQIGPAKFRKVRRRFLNELADAMGDEHAHETTVVFDASTPPPDLPAESIYKGLTVVFAIDDESADARIERMVAEHPNPKALTVVSSDHRIRQAATRRRAAALTADRFLDDLDRRRQRKSSEKAASVPRTPPLDRTTPPTAEEAAYWLEAFGDLDETPEAREAFSSGAVLLTDAEIAELEREIEGEF